MSLSKKTATCLRIPILLFVFGHLSSAETGYITYQTGTTNIILTAPHGGSMKPSNIGYRDAGCWNSTNQSCLFVHDCARIRLDEDYARCRVVVGTDRNTKNLTEYLSDSIYNITGLRPYVIINQLHRSRLDANRLRDEAAFDDPVALAAWEEWHYYINLAKNSISGPAILFDIHAHIHPEGNIELGYLISGSKLDNNDLDPNISSIRHLASRASVTFEELLRGRSSLGYFLSEEGYSTVPSMSNPGPNGALYWYAGSPGTNTAVHGSKEGGVVDAIQIETPEPILLQERFIVLQYARSLAQAIVRFYKLQNNGGSKDTRINATDLCSRPWQHLGLFYSCLFCSQSFPSQNVHCVKQNWKPSFRFNRVFS